MQPNRSLLELGLVEPVEERLRDHFAAHVGGVWEDLARRSVPFLGISDTRWGPAARWWGGGAGGPLELDVVAESVDGKSLLIGEAKWSDRNFEGSRWADDLRARVARAGFVQERNVVFALWVKRPCAVGEGVAVVTPDMVLGALR